MVAEAGGDFALRDRVRGTLVGLAAGDLRGGAIRLGVRVAESLAERRRFDPADLLVRYTDWWREGGFDTGPVTGAVLGAVARGVAPEVAAAEVHREREGRTAGIHPARRAVGLAMAGFLSDEELDRPATLEAELTHRHPLAGELSATVVQLCRGLIRGDDWEEACSFAAEGRAAEIRHAFESAHDELPAPSSFGPDLFAAALHFVTRSDDLRAALALAIDAESDHPSVPALVGAIGGARWGASAVPPALASACQILRRVQRVADLLALDWSGPEATN